MSRWDSFVIYLRDAGGLRKALYYVLRLWWLTVPFVLSALLAWNNADLHIVLFAVGVAACWLGRRGYRRRQRAKVDARLGFEGAWAWIERVRQGWPGVCAGSGLAVREAIGGELITPQIVWEEAHPLGVALTCWLPPGMGPDALRAKAIEVAHGLRAQSARVFDAGQRGYVQLVLVFRDLLAETVELHRPGSVAADPFFAGRSELGEDVYLNLVSPASHGIVQGQTRSGKSVFCYGLLMDAAHRRDVRVVGCDPTGLLLSPFVVGEDSAGIGIGTGSMQRHADVLDTLVSIMDRRIAQMLRDGQDKVDVSPVAPLVLIVLEEYPALLRAAAAEDAREGRATKDKIEKRIAGAVSRLLAESAKAGFRLLLLVQRGDASIVGGAERSNIATRITLRVDNADAVRMLHEAVDPETQKSMLSCEVGTALVDAPSLPAFGAVRVRTPFVQSYSFYSSVVRDAVSQNPIYLQPLSDSAAVDGEAEHGGASRR